MTERLGTWAMVVALLVIQASSVAQAGNLPQKAASSKAMQAFLEDPKAPLTPIILQAFVASLANCKLTRFGPNYKCEDYKRYRKARTRRADGNLLAMTANVGMKLIGHRSPVVRYVAAGLMNSPFALQKKPMGIIVKAARTEKNPFVLARMLNTVGSQVKKDPGVKKLLLDSADHADHNVRMAAMTWFTNTFAEGVPKVLNKVLHRVRKDPNVDVRAFLCSRLYGTGDRRAIRVIKRFLKDKKTPRKLYAGCFRGLVGAWIGIPRPKNPSKEAYLYTLKLLRKKPRDNDHPPWTIFSTLGYATEQAKHTFQQQWLKKVKGWYRAEPQRKVLAEIILDDNVRWLGRSAAVRSYLRLGATKADLKRLRKALGKGKNDRFVLKAMERTLNQPRRRVPTKMP